MSFYDSPPNRGEIYLVVTTPKASPVSVNIRTPLGVTPAVNQRGTVSSTKAATFVLPHALRNSVTGETKKGIRITASDEIHVAVLNGQSCGAYRAIPTDALGMEYYVTTWQPALTDEKAYITVRATEDQTLASLTFPPNRGIRLLYNGGVYTGGSTLTVRLTSDESFTLEDSVDLSGTAVRSNRPVAVFAGNNRVSIGSITASDTVVSQFAPVNTWGRRFIQVANPGDTAGGLLKILSRYDRTNIAISGNVGGQPLNQVSFIKDSASSGDVMEYPVVAGANLAIWSDKPVQVVYYSAGDRTSRPVSLLIPPVEQYMSQYSFSKAPSTVGSPFTTYVLLSAETNAASGVLLDDVNIGSRGWLEVQTPWRSDMVVKYETVSEGAHTLRHRRPGTPVGAAIYGVAPSLCAYAYPAGMYLKDLDRVSIQ